MALITCPDCGKQVSENAPTCPHCGSPLKTAAPSGQPQKPEKKKGGCLRLIGIAFLALFGLAVIGSLIQENEQSTSSSPQEPGLKPEAPKQAEDATEFGRGRVLKWKELMVHERRLNRGIRVSIMLEDEQSQINQDDLVATVMQAAKTYYVPVHYPIARIMLLAFEPMTKSYQLSDGSYREFGEGKIALASAVYSPEHRGNNSSWILLQAVPRPFSDQELEYLKLFDSMLAQSGSSGSSGYVIKDKLDQDIRKKMGIKDPEFNPKANRTVEIEPPAQKSGITINLN